MHNYTVTCVGFPSGWGWGEGPPGGATMVGSGDIGIIIFRPSHVFILAVQYNQVIDSRYIDLYVLNTVNNHH